MGKRIFLFTLLICLHASVYAFSVPPADQTGNLLVNGNFESGTTSWVTTASFGGSGPSAFTVWSQYVNTLPSVSTEQFTSLVIDGQYSGRIQGGINDGIDQYNNLGAGDYTLSAWVYVLSGSAYIGLAYGPIYDAHGLSSNTDTTLNTWVYLQLTRNAPDENGGPWIYAASDNSDFLVDCVWLNAGSVNLSPYAPQNGFPDPNTQSTILAPNVVNISESAAEATLRSSWLWVGAYDSNYNASIPTGNIVSQDPPAGTSVSVGSSVNLTTSLGPVPATMTVPNVVGMTLAAAENYLSAVAFFTTGTVSQVYSSTVAAGYVISQSPTAGTTVATYSAVNLTASQGPQPVVMVTVPRHNGCQL